MSQDPKQTVEWLKAAAFQGSADAQYQLGLLYEAGEGVPKADHYVRALKWFNAAAERGHSGAAEKLKQEVRRTREMASDGDPSAQNIMGLLYDEKIGVRKDVKRAMMSFRKAAAQGDALALTNLAIHYHDGAGVRQDYHEAFRLFLEAAEQGVAAAQHGVGFMLEEGFGTGQKLP